MPDAISSPPARKPQFAMIRQISGVAILQILQMGLSAIAGFLLIRALSKDQYAMYNLLVIGQATLIAWASGPLVGTFVPFANRLRDQYSLHAIVREFSRLNRPFLPVALVVTLGLIGFSALRSHWLTPEFALAGIMIIAAAIIHYRLAFVQSALKVDLRGGAALATTVRGEVIRLVLLAGVIAFLPLMPAGWFLPLVSLPTLMAIGITTAWAVRNWRNEEPRPQGRSVPDARALYWELLRPVFFSGYFFFTVNLAKSSIIYFVSHTEVIAEAAAIGRLIMLLSLIDKAVELIAMPRLGHQKDIARYWRLFFLGGCILAVLLLAVVASAWIFPGLWLWLLGENYTGLNSALLLAVSAACIERLSGYLLFGQLARGLGRYQLWISLASAGSYFMWIGIHGLATAQAAAMALFVSAVVGLVGQSLAVGRNLSMRGKT